jgi:hypothetical protein
MEPTRAQKTPLKIEIFNRGLVSIGEDPASATDPI